MQWLAISISDVLYVDRMAAFLGLPQQKEALYTAGFPVKSIPTRMDSAVLPMEGLPCAQLPAIAHGTGDEGSADQ
jgi:hypothetical protein